MNLSHQIMSLWLSGYILYQEKKISCNYTQKDRAPLFSRSPKNNDIKDVDRSLSNTEGCPSLLGRNRSKKEKKKLPSAYLYNHCAICATYFQRAFFMLLNVCSLQRHEILLCAELRECPGKQEGSPWPCLLVGVLSLISTVFPHGAHGAKKGHRPCDSLETFTHTRLWGVSLALRISFSLCFYFSKIIAAVAGAPLVSQEGCAFPWWAEHCMISLEPACV